MSIDQFLSRERRPDYSCLDFVMEVWEWLTGAKLDLRYTKGHFHSVGLHGIGQFKRLASPESPCIVLMQRNHTTPHVGIFYEGKILHLTEHGAMFQRPAIARIPFTSFRYYR